MGGVGGELGQRFQSLFETIEHSIEHAGEAREFVAGLGLGQAFGQIFDADGMRGFGERLDGFERSSAEPPSTEAGDPDDRRQKAPEEPSKEFERVVNAGQGRLHFQVKGVSVCRELFVKAAGSFVERRPGGKSKHEAVRSAEREITGRWESLAEFVEFVANFAVGGALGQLGFEVGNEPLGALVQVAVEFGEEAMAEREPEESSEEAEGGGENDRVPEGQTEAYGPALQHFRAPA